MIKILMICGVMLLVSCLQELKPEKCGYCGGHIYWHQINSGGFKTTHFMNSIVYNGKKMHPWCAKTAQGDK